MNSSTLANELINIFGNASIGTAVSGETLWIVVLVLHEVLGR